MTDQLPTKEQFNFAPKLIDWTGNGGAPFDVASLYPHIKTLIEIRECDLNVEGARALRDWLNRVIP